MNKVIINGYLQKKADYVKDEYGKAEFRFFLNTYSYSFNESFPIPFKVAGDKATECWAKVSVGDYIEVVGEIVRPNPQSMYVMCQDIMCRKPKSKKEYYLKTTEFLEFYNPESVIEKANNKKGK